MPIFANERYSGENHVSAANRAQTNAGIVGGNFVFTNGRQLALTVAPVTGEVSVAEGAFAFSGRLGGVTLSESASYTPPPSDTSYIKNVVIIRYNRNAATNVETFSLAVVSSEIQASESAAQAVSVSLATDTITEGTAVAEFPLWSFVASASSATVPVQLFNLCPSLSELKNNLSQTNKDLAEETAARKALGESVALLKSGVVKIAAELTGTNYYQSSSVKRADYAVYILKFSNQETMVIPSSPGTYQRFFYKIEDVSIGTATKVTEMNQKVTLQTAESLSISFGGTSKENGCPYVTEIYGVA